jgi:hypothetical protein
VDGPTFEPRRHPPAVRDDRLRPATDAGLVRRADRSLTVHDTLPVPFVLQLEGEEPPDLSGFTDPIRVPARIAWVKEEVGSENTDASARSIASAPYPGEFNTNVSLSLNHETHAKPFLDLLDMPGLVKGLQKVLVMPTPES